ncbi:copper transporter 5.1-like [Syzygium oleosum]|uniref:copper transporter 5.1-like n=1 Tax=Syzygium oleosum TaxID=219896 RepID=UPI0011D268E0|nr:copper transporter 5.1-like [Syzygium oleosum]
MMHMTFYWSREVTLLVDSWKTTSWTSYAFSILACFLASAFYQFMEDCRVRLKLASSSSSSPSSASADAAKPSSAADADAAAAPEAPLETPLLGSKASSAAAGGKKGWTVARVGGSVLFGLNSAIGYLLMLAVMSFNGGVFLSVVCGLGVGYLVFRSGTDDAVTVTATAAADNACACA